MLTRFAFWTGVDLGLPVQFHVGYGDSDIDLHRCDPLLLTPLLRATAGTGVPIMLLHNYPFHRHAGYLAQVFDHVFVDVGLTMHGVGNRAREVLAELFELAPFGAVLFSTDAFGLAELYAVSTALFRDALDRVPRRGRGRRFVVGGRRPAHRPHGLRGQRQTRLSPGRHVTHSAHRRAARRTPRRARGGAVVAPSTARRAAGLRRRGRHGGPVVEALGAGPGLEIAGTGPGRRCRDGHSGPRLHRAARRA